MSIFGIHICMDEIRAAMMCMPFVGVGLMWVRMHLSVRRTK